MLQLVQRQIIPAEDQRRVVLVVDSDPTFRAWAKRVLKELDVNVVEADDAEAALWCLESNRRPSLISLDARLPRMSGFRLCEEIRRHARMARVPIMIASSRTELEDHIRALEVGADEFLEKPIRASDYVFTAGKLLEGYVTAKEVLPVAAQAVLEHKP
jgi:DNA-binding response OmpR family regulator